MLESGSGGEGGGDGEGGVGGRGRVGGGIVEGQMAEVDAKRIREPRQQMNKRLLHSDFM